MIDIQPSENEEGKYKSLTPSPLNPRVFLDIAEELRQAACSNEYCPVKNTCGKFHLFRPNAPTVEEFPNREKDKGCGWFFEWDPDFPDRRSHEDKPPLKVRWKKYVKDWLTKR
jgi:hypothetical protein